MSLFFVVVHFFSKSSHTQRERNIWVTAIIQKGKNTPRKNETDAHRVNGNFDGGWPGLDLLYKKKKESYQAKYQRTSFFFLHQKIYIKKQKQNKKQVVALLLQLHP